MNSYKPLVRDFRRLFVAVALGLMLGWTSGIPFNGGGPFEPYAQNVAARLASFAVFWLAFIGLKRVATVVWRKIPLPEIPEWGRDFDFPSWVALRRLGESNAVKLTALAPVLGSLILMNDEVAAFLRSSLLDLKVDETKQLMLGFIPVPRLHMIYLGLSLLGIGAICFGLLCPDVIKRYPSAEAWLEGEDRFLSGGLLRREFHALVQTYWDNTQPEESDLGEHGDEGGGIWDKRMLEGRIRRFGYSQDRYWKVHVFIDEIIETDDPLVDQWAPPASEPSRILGPDGLPAVRQLDAVGEMDDERLEYWQRFRAGVRGHVNTDAWLSTIAFGYPFERGLWEHVAGVAAEKFKERIVHIRFNDFAHEQRAARGSIAAIYGLGLIALAVPTLHTFGAIIFSAFAH